MVRGVGVGGSGEPTEQEQLDLALLLLLVIPDDLFNLLIATTLRVDGFLAEAHYSRCHTRARGAGGGAGRLGRRGKTRRVVVVVVVVVRSSFTAVDSGAPQALACSDSRVGAAVGSGQRRKTGRRADGLG